LSSETFTGSYLVRDSENNYYDECTILPKTYMMKHQIRTARSPCTVVALNDNKEIKYEKRVSLITENELIAIEKKDLLFSVCCSIRKV
jgi:hypothetical protein